MRFVELLEGNGDDEPYSAALETTAEVDVEWAANAPTPFDADHFAGLALNESSGAPILQDFDSAVPIDVRFMARYDDEHGWHDVEFDEVALDGDEHDHPSSRLTAAEALHYELEEPDEE